MKKSRTYKTVGISTHSLRTKFPHTPEDTNASLDDFPEDQHAQGHELVSLAFRGESSLVLVFRA